MKKKYVFIIFATTLLAVTGCEKNNTTQNEVIDVLANNITNDNVLEVENIENAQNIDNSLASVSDAKTNPYAEAYAEGVLIKAGELWFMPENIFEEWCKKNYPEIANNLGCTWDDIEWNTAKMLLYKTVFGSAYPEWAEDMEIAAQFGVETAKSQEDIEQERFNEYAPDYSSAEVLYFEPPTGFIKSKSTEEKRDYFKEMFAYLYDSDCIEEMQKAVDLMSDDDIEGMADDMAKAIEKSYPNYTYSKGDEYREKTNALNDNTVISNNLSE